MNELATGYRPFYRLPIELRALPFGEREQALRKWERIHGTYDWRAGTTTGEQATERKP